MNSGSKEGVAMKLRECCSKFLFTRSAYRGVWFDKLVIIGNVLLHDWRILPPYGVSPSIAKIPRSEILSTYAGFDEESLQHILRFHECC